MARKTLIVGGVAGGASAAARLRRLDETAEIIMFERGDYISFANCGLPYHIGGTIENRDDLLLQTPESFKKRFNIEVRTKNEVVKIDRGNKQVEVLDLDSGDKYVEAYEKLYLHPANHVGYYPGAKQMYIKVLFTKPEGKILGAQIVGSDGVDRRIDIFAVAIRAGLTVFDLQELELAYAPPYGSGKDAVNMAGFAASNILDGTVDVAQWDQICDDDYILDVRTAEEFDRANVPSSVNIPVDELRRRLNELPTNTAIDVYCSVGIRSYIACRILMQNRFDARNISGGFITYCSYENKELLDTQTARQLKEEFCLI